METSPNGNMQVQELPVTDIYPDPEFNVRGEIPPGTVIDLARNIERNGLLQPISVQPFDREVDGRMYPWRIVVGHRRHRAYQVKEWDTIPCIVKKGLDDLDAFTLNFIENVNREQLNLMEEARGLEKFVNAGLSIEKIAQRTNKGKGWIQIRLAALELPKPIQAEAAAGYITQEQIRDIRSLPSEEAQYEAVRRIKDAKINGEKRALKVKEVKPSDPRKSKKRTEQEIDKMIEHLLDTVGPCLASRALAWANGNIPEVEFIMDLREECINQGQAYDPPVHVKPLVASILSARKEQAKEAQAELDARAAEMEQEA